MDSLRIGGRTCPLQKQNSWHLQRHALRQRRCAVQHVRSQAQPAKPKRGRQPKEKQTKSKETAASSPAALTAQPKDEGRDGLADEIERLRAENARIKQQLSGAADTLRQAGVTSADAGRLNSGGGADVQKESSASNGTRSNGSSKKAASGSPAALPSASSPAGESVAASRDFLEFQPPAGMQVGSTAGASSGPDSAPPPSDAAPAAATAAAAPAASAAVAAPQQSAAPQQQQQSPVQVSNSAGQGADTAPQQRAADGVQQAEQLLDIVFVSSEAGPWSKTGGLGDVVGSLPVALSRRGHRVMVVTPRYQNGTKTDQLYEVAADLEQPTTLAMGACGEVTVNYHHAHRQGVDWVFVDHPCFHRPGGLYTDEHGVFGDNQFRFALLSLAACEAPLVLNIGGHRIGWPPGFPYGDRCVFVANDWHASLVPVYLAGRYRRHGVYKDARTILAIHNMAHQGVEPAATFANLGVPDDMYDPMGWEYPTWSHVNGPAVNLLKGGVLTADRVMTVSKGYAWEITTPEGGWGLDGVLQGVQHKLDGIANGIDTTEWSPETDDHLPASYSAADMSGKAACKAALQRELGLPEDAGVPLLGFIGRLDFQKGPDLVLAAAGELAARNVQMVMLGSGGDEYETAMRDNERQFPQHFRGWVGFSLPVAHRMVAGCDALLMPSRFEPCGLNQLFAMAYGTVPIAHATGGLRDTIAQFQPDKAGTPECGTGFVFSPPEANAMLQAVDHAVHLFRNDERAWRGLQQAGMAQDLSWEKAAVEYEQLFGWALMDPPARPW